MPLKIPAAYKTDFGIAHPDRELNQAETDRGSSDCLLKTTIPCGRKRIPGGYCTDHPVYQQIGGAVGDP